MKADFLQQIAENDEWYKEIKKYRNENEFFLSLLMNQSINLN